MFKLLLSAAKKQQREVRASMLTNLNVQLVQRQPKQIVFLLRTASPELVLI